MRIRNIYIDIHNNVNTESCKKITRWKKMTEKRLNETRKSDKIYKKISRNEILTQYIKHQLLGH